MGELLNDSPVFFLVFARMVGFLFFNPIFGKKNLPQMVKVGLAAAISFAVTKAVAQQKPEINTDILAFGVAFCFELFLGFVISLILETMLGAIVFGGELFDMQMGLSMNKFYDQSSGTEMPVTGSLIRVLFMLTFFLTNSHGNLLRIVYGSYFSLPIAGGKLNAEAFYFVVALMKDLLEIGLKMAMPMFAAILLMDIGVGILMRAVPQLDVFVLNIYIKFIVGFLLLLKLGPNLAEFSQSLTEAMFLNVGKFVAMLGH